LDIYNWTTFIDIGHYFIGQQQDGLSPWSRLVVFIGVVLAAGDLKVSVHCPVDSGHCLVDSVQHDYQESERFNPTNHEGDFENYTLAVSVGQNELRSKHNCERQ